MNPQAMPVAHFDVVAQPIMPHYDNKHTADHHKQHVPMVEATAAPVEGASARFGLNRSASQKVIPETTLRMLSEQGYPRGLASSLYQNKRAMPLRIWVVDNSGSMRTADGNRIVMDRNNRITQIVNNCSRWSEMQQTVEYHARIAHITGSPTIFRLLNDPGINVGPQQFSISQSEDSTEQEQRNELDTALRTMRNASPCGVTPLTQHMIEIRQNVLELAPQLRQDGTKVAIIVATDGLPSDQFGTSNEYVKAEFEESLRALEGLPIWIVVRLCTDEDDVVQYWNAIDSKLELSIEVLDDFVAEAQELFQHNKWLTYGLPLHRIREMGYYSSIMDILDERKLTKYEVKEFCSLLFGSNLFEEIPDPEIDFEGFCRRLDYIVQNEQKQWNPITKRMEPWIDMRALRREYSTKSGIFGFLFG